MKKSVLVLVALCCIVANRADAAPIVYTATLAPEAAGATGSGSTVVTYDPALSTLQIEASWTGLSGMTTVSHIHCCTAVPGVGTAGVAVTPGTLPGFPAGVSSGSYSSPVLDLTDSATYTAAFISDFAFNAVPSAEPALIDGINEGRAYLNIHSTTFGGGEIRGFLAQVPEPATLLLVGLGAAAVGARRRRRV